MALSLISMLLPFLTVKYQSIVEEEWNYVTYGSFKVTTTYTWLGRELKNETMTFTDYWFAPTRIGYSPPSPSEMGVSWAILAIFIAQVLVVLLGVISLFSERNWAPVLPLMGNVVIILLMAYVWLRIRSHTYYESTYTVGYSLLLISTLLYTLAFFLGSVSKGAFNKKTRNYQGLPSAKHDFSCRIMMSLRIGLSMGRFYDRHRSDDFKKA